LTVNSILEKIISLVKNRYFCGFLFAAALWLMVWSTYNTDITRLLVPGFPHNALDLIHGLRSLLPFVAVVLALVFLFKKRRLPENFFLTPMGLLLIYAILGSISSVFSKEPFMALYWSALYGIVILVLLAVLTSPEPLKKLSLIININWAIAGILTIALLVFFLIQPGVLSSFHANFLICYQRPYESLGNVPAALQTFGMVGTRPTGWGRYAGVMAIIALASFFYNKKYLKIIWFLLFIISLFILLFSRGRTEIVAFIFAAIFVIWLAKKINIFSIFGICFLSLLSVFIVFYSIPCTNSFGFISYFIPKNITIYPIQIQKNSNVVPSNQNSANVVPSNQNSANVVPSNQNSANVVPSNQNSANVVPSNQNSANDLALKSIKDIFTLSGRIDGVWIDAGRLFMNNPLVGYGFQADRFFLNGQHAHNTILQVLIQTGIFGTIPFLLAFVFTFIILYKLFKKNMLEDRERYFLIAITAALVFFAVRSITESVAFFSADWLFVAPIIAYIQCLNDNKLMKSHEN